MSDSYQAIYDAVRSRISGGNINEAIEAAMRNAGIGEQAWAAGNEIQQAIRNVADAMYAPSAVYRPAISIDGNQWCALYGDNLQDGVCGFGHSPALAMADFDKNWHAKLPVKAAT